MPLPNVTVVAADDTDPYVESAALVAVTEQVPTVVRVSVLVAPEVEMLQPVEAVAKVTVPVPEPPDVVNVRGVAIVPVSEVIVSVPWVAAAKVTVVATEFPAL